MECNKCVFLKCCKDNGKNLKNCAYFEDDETLLICWMKKDGLLGKDEKLTDKKVKEALNLRQKLHVEDAKEKLKAFFSMAFIIILFCTTVVTFFFGDSYAWTKIYLQFLGAVGTFVLAGFLTKGIYSLIMCLYKNIKIIVNNK